MADQFFVKTSTVGNKEITLNQGTPTSGKIPVFGTGGRLEDSTIATLIAGGVPAIVTSVNLVNQTADIAAASLTATAGFYRISLGMVTSTLSVLAGTATLTIRWADTQSGGGTITTSLTLNLALVDVEQSTWFLHVNSGNLTYEVNHTGIFSTAKYDLRIILERLL